MLLVDDIQFLAKREETQTEFFHTFNPLHAAGPPDRDRVGPAAAGARAWRSACQSRFRLGPVRRRAAARPGDPHRDPAAEGRARRAPRPRRRDRVRRVNTFDQNIRELEGALVRVVAWGDLTGQPIDQRARRAGARRTCCPRPRPRSRRDLILEESAPLLRAVRPGPDLAKPLAAAHDARHVAMYLMRECTRPILGQDRRHVRRTRPHDGPATASSRSRRTCGPATATYRQVQDLTRIIRGRARAG